MNVLNHYVTQIICPPIYKNNHWKMVVLCNCEGYIRPEVLRFCSKEECDSVSVGYCFQS